LPILDNQISFVPFIDLKEIGKTIDPLSYEGGQLTMIYEGPLSPGPIQASFYSFLTPLRSDIFFKFPLSISSNLKLTRYLIPAMTIVQFFYPDFPKKENSLFLQKDFSLKIDYKNIVEKGKVEKLFMKQFLRAGFIGFPFLVEYPKPGNGIHYAGTIPMDRKNLKYHVDKDCLLYNTGNVYVIDGSVFPVLPARNYSFTIMANAKRAARILKKIL
jgi:choline dehydrogenase-like flavoprotein